jgi:proliferating cell nuclear antigen PCNA
MTKIQILNPAKCDALTLVFQNMKLFSGDVNVSLTPTAMEIQALDAGHVSIVELCIPAAWFDLYETEDAVVGINTGILSKILGTREKSQTIQIDIGNDNLLISFVSADTSVFNKTFDVPLLDLDAEGMTIPVVEYQAEFSLASSNFANLMNQLKMFGETMEIHCCENKIELFSHSLDCGRMSVEIRIDDLTTFSIEEGAELKLSFSLAYLYNIAQFHKLAKEVELKFKEGYPLQVVYYLAGDTNATLRLYLAPKIEDSE